MSKNLMINFNKNDIIKKFEEEIADQTCKIEALRKINRLHKKDGSDFALLTKNWENCKIVNEYGLGHRMYYYYKVNSRYCEDYVYITKCAKDMTDEEKATHEPSHYDFYNNVTDYLMNNDEIEERIKEYIERYENSNKALKEAIEMIKNGNVPIINHIEELVKEYDGMRSGKISDTNSSMPNYHLYYALHEYFY